MSFLENLVWGVLLLTLIIAYGLHLGLNVCVNLKVLLLRSLAPIQRRQTPLQFQRLPLTDYVLGVGSVLVILLLLVSNVTTTSHKSERNAFVRANAHYIQTAVEQYAADHAGTFPASLRDLAPIYLSALPRTPWGTQQALSTDIPATYQAPENVREWDPLGRYQQQNPRHPTDLGAIGYTRLGADGRHYRLSGTGKKGEDAVLVFMVTNQ